MSSGPQIPSNVGIAKRIAKAREVGLLATSPENLTALELAFFNRFQELKANV